MKTRVLAGLTVTVALLAPAAGAAEKADRIFVNGHIWTGEAARPWAEAVAVRGQTLLAVGGNADVRRLAERGTDVVDLKGRFACPGFGDAHVGLMSGSLGLRSVDLRDAQSLEELQRRIVAFAKANPESPWVTGRGWTYAAFPGGRPHKKWLDAVVSDRPAFLLSYDGHTAWANSPALLAAGIMRGSKDPADGRIVREPDGEPTGTLQEEGAFAAVRRLIPLPTPDEQYRALKKGLDLAASSGLTTLHDVAFNDEDSPLLERVEGEGGLKVRVFAAAPLARDGGADALSRLAGLRRRRQQSPRWRLGAVMGFVDGVVESRTAVFFEPYPGGGQGLLRWPELELERVVAAFDKEGFQVLLHAVGDRAVSVALNAFERAARANGTTGRHHRVEHAEVIRAQDLPRFAALGVVASTQPAFVCPDRNHFEVYLPALGPERGPHALAFKSLDDARAVQAFGSNWPSASISVLEGLYCAATRTSFDGAPAGGWVPAERLSVEAALRHYTRDVAAASLDESSRGTLMPGKLADLVVLSEDILAVPPERLLKTKVLLTVLGGQDTYRAKEF